ncbi:tyrosine- phosphatase non-receptor type 9 [Brachionus plicatilis]|uniref:Tyrosine-phosphatase non-receptor type 9 n=1 Tax=Brachionus plicatilis TaxID=10195 RepID=A0A3M7P8C3_BRAPC|nr:tyrosine- phosphatase non-receptor type 9 [Brachionus plicatilis]
MKTKDLASCLVEPLSELIEQNNLNDTHKNPVEQSANSGKVKNIVQNECLANLDNFTSASQIQVNLISELKDQEKKSDSTNCKYKHKLRDSERLAVDEFLKKQNWSNSDARNWNIAVKFLMARKFDVDRAIKLYKDHENLRRKECLDFVDIDDDDFISELHSGKFTILPFLKNYPVCALFTVRLNNGCSNPSYELTTLKTLIYQLDAALENPEAQRNGINFIYDMNDCKRSNYDLSLSQKILTLVRGSYPARLNKLFVVAAPFWFKCIVKVLSILMREKLRERVLFVSNEELRNQIPPEILPEYLGGTAVLNHSNWLIECNKLVTNKASTCSFYYIFDSVKKNKKFKMSNSDKTQKREDDEDELNVNRKRQSTDILDIEEKSKAKKQLSSDSPPPFFPNKIAEKIEPIPFVDYYQSLQNVDPADKSVFTIDELVNHVISAGAYGLSDEFRIIRNLPINSSIDAFKDRENANKNRYRDVLCLDESRIKLVSEKNKFDDQCAKNDYIHGNYVDGYKQKNAYISTQGPLDETVEDFWRMIWQEFVLVIAMTTKVYEQRKLKCAQYWPLEKDATTVVDNFFEIKNESVEDLDDYKVTRLSIKYLPTGKTRKIVHCQFLSWPDHGVPKTASQILDFIQLVRKHQSECLNEMLKNTKWTGHPLGPPICVHCSAGIGRTGTFCAIDISINRLIDCKTVNIFDTVNKIRLQRAQSVQMRDQYVFCYLAVLEYAQKENLYVEHESLDLAKIFDDMF